MTTTEIAAEVADIHNLVGGQLRGGPAVDELRHPYDGRVVARVHAADPTTVDDAVESAREAFRSWRTTPSHRRAQVLAAVATTMRAEAEDFAHQITLETGKTLAEARGEVSRSIATMEISAEEAKRIGGEVVPMDAAPQGAGKLGFAVRVPMGVIACITPFNAPLNTLCHKVGPALAAGNCVVVKPHPHGAGIAARLARAFLDNGALPGCFNVVHGGAEVGQSLVTHPNVVLVNFTGSGAVADQIVRQIGLKRVLLELGGNAPTIVHHDADLDRAGQECLGAAFGLGGQSCISTQRIYVHRDVYEPFVARLVDDAKSIVTGDPFDPATKMGPMISEAAAKRVQVWIEEAVAAGAVLRCGGERDGTMVTPAVLTDVRQDMRIVCEEVFGPVVTVSAYDDRDEVIRSANDSPWGLKCGVFTGSLAFALKAAAEMEFGTVNINGPSRARVDHEPSGGTKQSGWGTEGPRYAIEAMTYLRMVSMAP
jgi:acyl-CoA reductase-like NAD-dependent aldehyde dehydrogenase